MTCDPCNIWRHYLQPFTFDELSLVEDMMSGKFNIPSAKEAKALLKGTASLSQKEKKRKRLALLDTRVVDDPKGYRLSKAETNAIQTGKPPVSASVKPSSAKSTKKVRYKSSEGEGLMTVTLPTEGSASVD